MKQTLLFLFLCTQLISFAGELTGHVSTKSGIPLAYANIYSEQDQNGVVTNLKGDFKINLSNQKHTVRISFLGYETVVKEIDIKDRQTNYLKVVLEETHKQLAAVEVKAKQKNKGRLIVGQANAERTKYLKALQGFQCKTYIKTVMEKEFLDNDTTFYNEAKDSFKVRQISGIKKDQMIEQITETSFRKPGKYNEVVVAVNDYTKIYKNLDEKSINIKHDFGFQDDFMPSIGRPINPAIIYTNLSDAELNFYKNFIHFDAISNKPIPSPIGNNYFINYSYELIHSYMDNDHLIHKIKVTPNNKVGALFDGHIYIEEESWKIRGIDLTINDKALNLLKSFHIIQNYETVEGASVPTSRVMQYHLRNNGKHYTGNIYVKHSDYQINPEFERGHFSNAVLIYDSYAFDKDSAYWSQERTVALEEDELEYEAEVDSNNAYYESEAFYRKADSAYHRLGWYSFLVGIGRRNRALGIDFYMPGIPNQINPFGVGGYRHLLPWQLNKQFKNGNLIETKGMFNYGFTNKDLKGSIGVGYTYVPIKFVRTAVEVGNTYERINNYASIEQTFSRSNYVHSQHFAISQRMEVYNGIMAELSYIYADKKPITDIEHAKWAADLFGELNTPTDFQPYLKSEVKLRVNIQPGQKYLIKNNRKHILPSKLPSLGLTFRKGLPGVFGSEVDFDYFDITLSDQVELAQLGTSHWRVNFGTFYNRSNLRLLEYRFFRGSDQIIFSNPLASFQLLGPTLSTRDEFIQLNYFHNFDGLILNKVPLIRKMKMSLAGGAGTLLIEDINFAHAEIFGGIMKTIRIKKDRFKIGLFATTSDDTTEGNINYRLKVGVDMYDRFANKWHY